MNTKPFLVRLTPTGTFFFGGEKSLSGTGNDNYFVRSRHFPQQTSLLGLLRMQLLAAHGLLPEPHLGKGITKPQEAEKLIGKHGFRQEYDGVFGQIEALGPVLLACGDEFFAPMSFSSDLIFSGKTGQFASVLSDDSPRGFLPNLNGFDPKNTPDPKLFGSAGSPPIQLDKIFGEKTRVGITKNQKHFSWLYPDAKSQPDREAEMEGFFKQVSFYFKNEAGRNLWQFAFVAWLSEEAGKKLIETATKDAITWLGGERSAFRFDISILDELPDFGPVYPTREKDLVRVVLISDAWAAPSEIYLHCLFAHTEAQEFRFLKSEVGGTTSYYQRGASNKAEWLRRSAKHALFRRGSVFFCREEQVPRLTTILKTAKTFRRIGYNAFSEVRQNVVTNFFKPENQ